MKRTILSLATAAAAFAGPLLVFAAPFDTKDVAADPAMILHADCDKIRTSAIGQYILSQPDVQDKLMSAATNFDFDFRKQLHGITVYMTEAHPKDAVMVVAADFDPDRLLTQAQAMTDFYGITNGSHVIYTWLDDKKKRREGGTARVYGAISGHHLIFGQSEARLADAVDVLEGNARCFDGKKGLTRPEAGEAILLEAALLKIDVGNATGPAALLKMSKTARLKVTEANHNTTAALRLETADEDTATQLSNFAQGLLGMLKMRQGDTNSTKFANSISIAQDDITVAVTLSMPSADMIELMKAGQKQGEQRRANRRARDENSKPDNK